jgi:hypothetical protein
MYPMLLFILSGIFFETHDSYLVRSFLPDNESTCTAPKNIAILPITMQPYFLLCFLVKTNIETSKISTTEICY